MVNEVEREFRFNDLEAFYRTMADAGIVVPRDDAGEIVPISKARADYNPGPPGQAYSVDYDAFNLSVRVGPPPPEVGDPAAGPDDELIQGVDRGPHMNMLLSGNRAYAISAQLDNYFRKEQLHEAETPETVKQTYNLKSESDNPNPNDKKIRKVYTVNVFGVVSMFELIRQTQGDPDKSEFYERKRVWG